MVLIISKKGDATQIVKPKKIGLEEDMQDFIKDHPEVIPFYEIEEGKKILVIIKEFSTNSGPVDAVGIDQEGHIYLIETKLEKNTDKRRVIAQILDYASSMWKNTTYYDFTTIVNNYLRKEKDTDLDSEIMDYFGVDDPNPIKNSINENISAGHYRLVIVMDRIDDALKDTITFLNTHTDFDIYGIELNYYEYNGMEIVSPNIIGTEIRKEHLKPTDEDPSLKNFMTKVKEKVTQETEANFEYLTLNPKRELNFAIIDNDENGYLSYQAHKYANDSLKIGFFNSLKDHNKRAELTKEIEGVLPKLTKEIGNFEFHRTFKGILKHDLSRENQDFDDNLINQASQKIIKLMNILNPIIEKYIN